MRCINCGRERGADEGHTLVLSEEDRAIISRATQEQAPPSYFYCKPCYRVVTDREMGARLIASQVEIRLRLAGHPRPSHVGEAVYRFLIEKSAPKQVS